MRTDWAPFARRRIYPRWATGPFRDPVHRKAVWHTTEGHDTVLDWYETSGGIPHFTILTTGIIYQHYACSMYSRALRNLRGGVETNTDGAIQVEIVGFAGREHTLAQRNAIIQLAKWLTEENHVAPVFPMGRLSKPYLQATEDQWDNGVGHFAHGHIPEQDHTDPNMTDLTWAALRAGVHAGEPEEPLVERDDLIRPGDVSAEVLLHIRRLNALLELQGSSRRIGESTRYHDLAVRATKSLQRWADIEVDGIVGPVTRTAIHDALLLAAVSKERERFGFQPLRRRHPSKLGLLRTPWE